MENTQPLKEPINLLAGQGYLPENVQRYMVMTLLTTGENGIGRYSYETVYNNTTYTEKPAELWDGAVHTSGVDRNIPHIKADVKSFSCIGCGSFVCGREPGGRVILSGAKNLCQPHPDSSLRSE